MELTMASKLPATAVLFFLAFAAVTNAFVPANASPQDTCHALQYPDLCQKLIETYHPASQEALLEAAIQETIARLREGKKKAEAIGRKHAKGSYEAINTAECASYYGDAADSLEQNAMGCIRSGERKSLASYTSSVSSNVEGCYDLFDVNNEFDGKMEFPGSDIYVNLSKHAANLIKLACQYAGTC